MINVKNFLSACPTCGLSKTKSMADMRDELLGWIGRPDLIGSKYPPNLNKEQLAAIHAYLMKLEGNKDAEET